MFSHIVPALSDDQLVTLLQKVYPRIHPWIRINRVVSAPFYHFFFFLTMLPLVSSPSPPKPLKSQLTLNPNPKP